MKQFSIEDVVEYDNRGNGAFSEWWFLKSWGVGNKWLKEVEGKRVKITVEVIE